MYGLVTYVSDCKHSRPVVNMDVCIEALLQLA